MFKLTNILSGRIQSVGQENPPEFTYYGNATSTSDCKTHCIADNECQAVVYFTDDHTYNDGFANACYGASNTESYPSQETYVMSLLCLDLSPSTSKST